MVAGAPGAAGGVPAGTMTLTQSVRIFKIGD